MKPASESGAKLKKITDVAENFVAVRYTILTKSSAKRNPFLLFRELKNSNILG